MIYSLIQARGGSKGMPKKNLKLLGGYPLIAYSIAVSKLCKSIKRTLVSTDSSEIAEVAKHYGAEVPFLRPLEFAQDKSTDLEVFSHAVKWLEKNEGLLPDLLIQLRPTTPLRDKEEIERAIQTIQTNSKATSLRSAHKVDQPPQKMFRTDSVGFWTGFFPDDTRPEYYNLPRQTFPDAYCPNGYVDIVKTDFIKNNPNRLYGPQAIAFVTPFVNEISFSEDLEYAEHILKQRPNEVYEYLSKNFPKET